MWLKLGGLFSTRFGMFAGILIQLAFRSNYSNLQHLGTLTFPEVSFCSNLQHLSQGIGLNFVLFAVGYEVIGHCSLC